MRYLLSKLFIVFIVTLFSVQSAFAQSCTEPGGGCTAYALNDVAAAFNTEGYYAQSKLLEQVRFNILGGTESANTSGKTLRLLAPLMYILAVIGAIFMMGFGQPPKLWIWFLVGPGIFHFLVQSTVDKKGVAWVVAGEPKYEERVWRLSQVGIQNLPDTNADQVHENRPPDFDAKVSQVFSIYDDLVSAFVQSLVRWLGVFSQSKGNLQTTSPGGVANNDGFWYIMSNNKWPMLEGITGSLVKNANIRETLVVMMTNECGDIISSHIDQGKFAQAAKGDASSLPDSVFMGTTQGILDELSKKIIPMPEAIREVLKQADIFTGDPGVMGFADALNLNADMVSKIENISCADLLYIAVQSIRYEAGHVYTSTLDEAGQAKILKSGTNKDEVHDQVAYSFLYGWDFGILGTAEDLSSEDQKKYIKSLIVFHLLRNELAMARQVANPRFGNATRIASYGQQFNRTIGSKQKFSELYQWARLLPYMQGLLLYFLCIAYPLVCMLMVVPGWWKTLITWASFYAWAKSWDIGFALVMSIERSIWSMLGRTDTAVSLNEKMIEPAAKDAGNITLDFCLVTSASGCEGVNIQDGLTGDGYLQAVKTFDLGLLFSNALDLDVRNGYYIYLMSALYFAVPAVTGQMLLGAKAGAAGLVTNAFQSSAQEFGGKAGAGALDHDLTRGINGKQSMNQENAARGLRENGLGVAALQSGNKAASLGVDSTLLGQKAAVIGDKEGDLDKQFGRASAAAQQRAALLNSAINVVSAGMGGGGAQTTGPRRTESSAPEGSAPTGSSTGATGSSTTGATTGAANQQSKGGVWSAITTAAKEYVGHNAAGMTNEMLESRQAQGYQNMGLAAGHRIAQAHQSGLSSGYQQLAGRQQAAAQFQASESAWRRDRDFGESMSGKMGAMGAMAGSFAAGPRSTDANGLASVGRLDTYQDGVGGLGSAQAARKKDDGKGAFGFFDVGGAYQGQVKAATQGAIAYGQEQGVYAQGANAGQAFTNSIDTNGYASVSMAGNGTSYHSLNNGGNLLDLEDNAQSVIRQANAAGVQNHTDDAGFVAESAGSLVRSAADHIMNPKETISKVWDSASSYGISQGQNIFNNALKGFMGDK